MSSAALPALDNARANFRAVLEVFPDPPAAGDVMDEWLGEALDALRFVERMGAPPDELRREVRAVWERVHAFRPANPHPDGPWSDARLAALASDDNRRAVLERLRAERRRGMALATAQVAQPVAEPVAARVPSPAAIAPGTSPAAAGHATPATVATGLRAPVFTGPATGARPPPFPTEAALTAEVPSTPATPTKKSRGKARALASRRALPPPEYPPGANLPGPEQRCRRCAGMSAEVACVVRDGMSKCDRCFTGAKGCVEPGSSAKGKGVPGYVPWYVAHGFTLASRPPPAALREAVHPNRLSDLPAWAREESQNDAAAAQPATGLVPPRSGSPMAMDPEVVAPPVAGASAHVAPVAVASAQPAPAAAHLEDMFRLSPEREEESRSPRAAVREVLGSPRPIPAASQPATDPAPRQSQPPDAREEPAQREREVPARRDQPLLPGGDVTRDMLLTGIDDMIAAERNALAAFLRGEPDLDDPASVVDCMTVARRYYVHCLRQEEALSRTRLLAAFAHREHITAKIEHALSTNWRAPSLDASLFVGGQVPPWPASPCVTDSSASEWFGISPRGGPPPRLPMDDPSQDFEAEEGSTSDSKETSDDDSDDDGEDATGDGSASEDESSESEDSEEESRPATQQGPLPAPVAALAPPPAPVAGVSSGAVSRGHGDRGGRAPSSSRGRRGGRN
ncbi:hypothetical protein BV20DRAFT_984008 [Pilatotrama ljubarskyi]|nr:hypothetical protein BV20DRAFT_984008 [Pilatotrama ljubarskyi]